MQCGFPTPRAKHYMRQLSEQTSYSIGCVLCLCVLCAVTAEGYQTPCKVKAAVLLYIDGAKYWVTSLLLVG